MKILHAGVGILSETWVCENKSGISYAEKFIKIHLANVRILVYHCRIKSKVSLYAAV